MTETTPSTNLPIPPAPSEKAEMAQPQKPINTIVLDSSPLLLNTPPLSTLIANSSSLISTSSVLSEIRDPDARSRVQTLYAPFLVLRTPKPESVKFVQEFARRTGDLVVLSRTDIEVLAVSYELECEKNGGDWRLRRAPGQKRTNGAPPEKQTDKPVDGSRAAGAEKQDTADEFKMEETISKIEETTMQYLEEQQLPTPENIGTTDPAISDEILQEPPIITDADEKSSSDSEGWITPSNIKKHQVKDNTSAISTSKASQTMQVATITGDFAMQNVLLQMNLNLLSPATCKRVTHLKQTILRCHACFATTKKMDKQFCDRCGKPTLTRVTCSINANGETKLHLRANMQWNNKGNVFSIPKPTAGTANLKWKGPKHGGGGKDGWGNHLILSEDQKEFVRAKQDHGREKMRDLMDEDYLPSILTGERSAGGGRVKVGAGRTVNSRKR